MKIKIALVVCVILCICVMNYSDSRYKIFESTKVIIFSAKYGLIPLLVIITPLCYIFYRDIVLPEEDYVEPGFKRIMKIIRGTLMYSLAICIFLFFTLHSAVLLSNEYLGSKTVFLNARVIRSYRSVYHGHGSFYVVLEDKRGKKTDLMVEKLYKVGTFFNGSFKRGYWGILYRRD